MRARTRKFVSTLSADAFAAGIGIIAAQPAAVATTGRDCVTLPTWLA
ncbi:hypothetical protein [Streptacidiphilus monticola]|uniref:Uncharacterized protein n=1 Tax=Streptacidiphilus monticola TaxID=2161674 RepID=A0ABW1G612_9ACTN